MKALRWLVESAESGAAVAIIVRWRGECVCLRGIPEEGVKFHKDPDSRVRLYGMLVFAHDAIALMDEPS